jgi:hypothetical protein
LLCVVKWNRWYSLSTRIGITSAAAVSSGGRRIEVTRVDMEGMMKWMNPIQSSDGFYEVKNIWDWKFPKWKFNGDMRGARRNWKLCLVTAPLWTLLKGPPRTGEILGIEMPP